MKKILFYCLIVSLLILNSCTNEELEGNDLVLPKTLKVTYPGSSENDIINFVYDGNKIVSVINKSERINYSYEDDKIVKIVNYSLERGQEIKSSEISFTYKNGSLNTAVKIENGNKSKCIYIYKEGGIIEKENYYFDNQTGKESKNTKNQILTVINGNLLKSVFNWESRPEITTTSHYDYDSNNNAFKNVLGFNLLLDQANFDYEPELNISCANNLEKHIESAIHGSDISFEPYANTMQYQYNAKGYPIKTMIYDYTERAIRIIEYTY